MIRKGSNQKTNAQYITVMKSAYGGTVLTVELINIRPFLGGVSIIFLASFLSCGLTSHINDGRSECKRRSCRDCCWNALPCIDIEIVGHILHHF